MLGDDKLGIAPKFVGQRSFVERCVVALATNRGLMLIGEPGTAKIVAERAAGGGDLRRFDADHPGQRRHHRGRHQVFVELRPAAGRGAERAFAGAGAALSRHEGRQDRPLRGADALSAGDAGHYAVDPQRPRHGHPGTARRGAHALRPRRLQRHRHGEHARSRRQRDERRPQAPLQFRDGPSHRRPARRDGAGAARDGQAAGPRRRAAGAAGRR